MEDSLIQTQNHGSTICPKLKKQWLLLPCHVGSYVLRLLYAPAKTTLWLLPMRMTLKKCIMFHRLYLFGLHTKMHRAGRLLSFLR
jgi:hypothetical protein